MAYCLLFWVVSWYTLLPFVRKRSRPYRERRFPGDSGVRMWLHCLRLHMEFGKVLVDRATAGITGEFSAGAAKEDKALLSSLHGQGKGVILLTGHVGCWHVASKALRDFVDSPVNILLHREAGDNDKHFFEHGEGDGTIRIINPHDGPASALMVFQALKRGEIVAVMGDRAFGDDTHTERVPFMGGTIPLPYSIFRLASVSGAPVAFFFAFREGPCKAWHQVSDVVNVAGDCGKSGEAYMPYLKRFAAALEAAVMAYPYQFFNFYDMWE